MGSDYALFVMLPNGAVPINRIRDVETKKGRSPEKTTGKSDLI
jgi:hypothetical protein